jgi:hypothetical protein
MRDQRLIPTGPAPELPKSLDLVLRTCDPTELSAEVLADALARQAVGRRAVAAMRAATAKSEPIAAPPAPTPPTLGPIDVTFSSCRPPRFGGSDGDE